MSDVEALVNAEVERRLSDPGFLRVKIIDLTNRIEAMQPKIEAHDALMASGRTMSITDAAKHFSLKPQKHVIAYLRSQNLLTRHDLPSDGALSLNLLVLRQAKGRDDEVHPQSMVEVRQLERWRTYLVPRIQRWVEENQL